MAKLKGFRLGKRSQYVPTAMVGVPTGPSATDWAVSSRRVIGMRGVVGWVDMVGSCSISTGRSVNKGVVWLGGASITLDRGKEPKGAEATEEL